MPRIEAIEGGVSPFPADIDPSPSIESRFWPARKALVRAILSDGLGEMVWEELDNDAKVMVERILEHIRTTRECHAPNYDVPACEMFCTTAYIRHVAVDLFDIVGESQYWVQVELLGLRCQLLQEILHAAHMLVDAVVALRHRRR